MLTLAAIQSTLWYCTARVFDTSINLHAEAPASGYWWDAIGVDLISTKDDDRSEATPRRLGSAIEVLCTAWLLDRVEI